MKRRDGGGVRQERIQRMHRMIQGAGDLPLDRFCAACSYQMGLTERTTIKYLRDLELLGFVEVDEALNLIREVKKE